MASRVSAEVPNFFSLVVSLISGILFTTVDRLIANANAWAVTWALPAFATAVAVWAIAMAGGIGRFKVASFAKLFMFIALISAMLQVANYDYYFRDLFMKAIPGGIDQMSGQSIQATANSWDVVTSQALDAMWSAWQMFSWWTPGHDLIVGLMLFLYLLCGVACVAAGFGTWLKGFVMTALYLPIGVPVLPLFIFQTTRPIVMAWIGALFSAVMVQALSVILALIVIGVQTYVLNAIITDTNSSPTARLSMLISAAIMFLIFGWIAKDIPSAAAQLCGGVHYSPYALVSATYGAVPVVGRMAAGGLSRLVNDARQTLRASGAGPAAASPPGPSLSSRTP